MQLQGNYAHGIFTSRVNYIETYLETSTLC